MYLKRRLAIFWSKGFILGLFLLLVNDHILKSCFHNMVTGKLSDLAGLFIFPMFFAAFFPKYKIHIYFITAIGFIFWKSPWSNGIIESWNSLNLFPISRIVDWTDLFALPLLPFSYRYSINYQPKLIRWHPLPIIILTAFGFIATSRMQYIPIGYNYKFPYGKVELITRMNLITKEDKQLPISLDVKNANHIEPNGNDTILFHISGYKEYCDTFYNKNGSIDTIRVYQVPKKDTVYLSNNILYYEMIVEKYFKTDKNINCFSVMAKLEITGDESNSNICLMGFDTRNCSGIFDEKSVTEELYRMQSVIEKKLRRTKLVK
jgi:hypothetical protein